jgi:hypothetical protein
VRPARTRQDERLYMSCSLGCQTFCLSSGSIRGSYLFTEAFEAYKADKVHTMHVCGYLSRPVSRFNGTRDRKIYHPGH